MKQLEVTMSIRLTPIARQVIELEAAKQQRKPTAMARMFLEETLITRGLLPGESQPMKAQPMKAQPATR